MNVLRRVKKRLHIYMIDGHFISEYELFIVIDKISWSRCVILCSLGIIETITSHDSINSRSEILT